MTQQPVRQAIDQPPDFLVLCSSLAATLRGFGQADYCAANAFESRCAYGEHGFRTVAIDWDSAQRVPARAEIPPA